MVIISAAIKEKTENKIVLGRLVKDIIELQWRVFQAHNLKLLYELGLIVGELEHERNQRRWTL